MGLKDMLSFIRKFISPSNTKKQQQADYSKYTIVEEVPSYIDYSSFSKPVIKGNIGSPRVLIIDDINYTVVLYRNDLLEISSKYNKNPLNDFEIVEIFDEDAGFIAHKYVTLDRNIIDYAILDLTLGAVYKIADGTCVSYDGVDIAIEILKQNPDAKILFVTAHTMAIHSPSYALYGNKFKRATGKDILAHTVSKIDNIQRTESVYTLLYGGDSEECRYS